MPAGWAEPDVPASASDAADMAAPAALQFLPCLSDPWEPATSPNG